MTTNNQLLAASGYGNISGNDLWYPPSVNFGVLKTFYERGFIDLISTAKWMQGQAGYRRTLKYVREAEVIVRHRSRNQHVEHDEFDATTKEVFMGEQADWSYKVDDWDWDTMSNKDFWMNSIRQGASRKINEYISKNMLCEVAVRADADNTGGNAGVRSGRFNNGSTATPREISNANVALPYINSKVILSERGITKEALMETFGDGALTIFASPTLEHLLYTSEFKNDLVANGSAEGLLISGMLPNTIYGSRTIITNLMPELVDDANNPVDYIVACTSGAVGFGGLTEKSRTHDGAPDGWEFIVQGLFTFGFEVFYPEAIVVYVIDYQVE